MLQYDLILLKNYNIYGNLFPHRCQVVSKSPKKWDITSENKWKYLIQKILIYSQIIPTRSNTIFLFLFCTTFHSYERKIVFESSQRTSLFWLTPKGYTQSISLHYLDFSISNLSKPQSCVTDKNRINCWYVSFFQFEYTFNKPTHIFYSRIHLMLYSQVQDEKFKYLTTVISFLHVLPRFLQNNQNFKRISSLDDFPITIMSE